MRILTSVTAPFLVAIGCTPDVLTPAASPQSPATLPAPATPAPPTPAPLDPPDGETQVTLTLDDNTIVVEAAWFMERTVVSNRPDCVSGVAVAHTMNSAVFLNDPSFLDTDSGTASRPLGTTGVSWGGEGLAATDEWVGVLRVVTWSSDLIELTLEDGEHCALQAPRSCATAEGTLVIEGARRPDIGGGIAGQAWYEDVASGTPVCSPGQAG